MSSVTDSSIPEPHVMERMIQQRLLANPEVVFSSLIVRRIPGGVCLQGVIEVSDDVPDVSRLAKEAAGVQQVINQLVVRRAGGDVARSG